MDKITLKALKSSIKKWKNILDGTDIDKGYENCALCQLFLDADRNVFMVDCEGCPVARKHNNCSETPYSNWVAHQKQKHSSLLPHKNSCPDCRLIVKEEIIFLESFLPLDEDKLSESVR